MSTTKGLTTYVTLLRAVNVGGKSVAMADLRALAELLGFTNVRSVLQSGNLIFSSDILSAAAIEDRLRSEAKARLRLETTFFVRHQNDLAHVVERNPFLAEAKADPSHLLVYVLANAATARHANALKAALVGPESIHVHDDVMYAFYPDGIARSKLTLALIEKHLATPATGRNWNTIQKLLVGPA